MQCVSFINKMENRWYGKDGIWLMTLGMWEFGLTRTVEMYDVSLACTVPGIDTEHAFLYSFYCIDSIALFVLGR